MRLILVAHTDRLATARILYRLAEDGHRVITAAGGREAIAAAERDRPSLAVVRVTLRDISGFAVLRALHTNPWAEGIGTLMLSARRGEADRLVALRLGADDCVSAPCSPEEIGLRVNAILRRIPHGSLRVDGCMEVGPLRIDPSTVTATVDGRAIALSPAEFRVLCALAARRGTVRPREELRLMLSRQGVTSTSRAVDMQLHRLRAKLGEAGSLVECVRGVGYRLVAAAG